tara:strand:- start:137 stop:832 length:696 start_codon:yes stop_codon:yes gene_type:complete
MGEENFFTSSRQWEEVEEIPQIQAYELRVSLAVRLNELGFEEREGVVPSNKIFKQLAVETGLDWRSLRDYWVGDATLNSRGYKKLFKAFRFVKLSKVNNSMELARTLTSRDCQMIILNYGFPRDDRLADHSESIELGLASIKELWSNSRKIPSDQIEQLKALVDFESEAEQKFQELENKGVFLYLAKIPSYCQPPEEMDIKKFVSGYSLFITTRKVETVTIEVDWSNTIIN